MARLIVHPSCCPEQRLHIASTMKHFRNSGGASSRRFAFRFTLSQTTWLPGTQFDQARIKLVSTISGKTHGEAMFPWNSGIEFSTRLHSAPHTFYIMPKHAQLVVQTKSSTGLMSFLTPWEDVAAFDMDLSLLTREGIFSKDITLRSGTVTMQLNVQSHPMEPAPIGFLRHYVLPAVAPQPLKRSLSALALSNVPLPMLDADQDDSPTPPAGKRDAYASAHATRENVVASARSTRTLETTSLPGDYSQPLLALIAPKEELAAHQYTTSDDFLDVPQKARSAVGKGGASTSAAASRAHRRLGSVDEREPPPAPPAQRPQDRGAPAQQQEGGRPVFSILAPDFPRTLFNKPNFSSLIVATPLISHHGSTADNSPQLQLSPPEGGSPLNATAQAAAGVASPTRAVAGTAAAGDSKAARDAVGATPAAASEITPVDKGRARVGSAFTPNKAQPTAAGHDTSPAWMCTAPGAGTDSPAASPADPARAVVPFGFSCAVGTLRRSDQPSPQRQAAPPTAYSAAGPKSATAAAAAKTAAAALSPGPPSAGSAQAQQGSSTGPAAPSEIAGWSTSALYADVNAARASLAAPAAAVALAAPAASAAPAAETPRVAAHVQPSSAQQQQQQQQQAAKADSTQAAPSAGGPPSAHAPAAPQATPAAKPAAQPAPRPPSSHGKTTVGMWAMDAAGAVAVEVVQRGSAESLNQARVLMTPPQTVDRTQRGPGSSASSQDQHSREIQPAEPRSQLKSKASVESRASRRGSQHGHSQDLLDTSGSRGYEHDVQGTLSPQRARSGKSPGPSVARLATAFETGAVRGARKGSIDSAAAERAARGEVMSPPAIAPVIETFLNEHPTGSSGLLPTLHLMPGMLATAWQRLRAGGGASRAGSVVDTQEGHAVFDHDHDPHAPVPPSHTRPSPTVNTHSPNSHNVPGAAGQAGEVSSARAVSAVSVISGVNEGAAVGEYIDEDHVDESALSAVEWHWNPLYKEGGMSRVLKRRASGAWSVANWVGGEGFSSGANAVAAVVNKRHMAEAPPAREAEPRAGQAGLRARARLQHFLPSPTRSEPIRKLPSAFQLTGAELHRIADSPAAPDAALAAGLPSPFQTPLSQRPSTTTSTSYKSVLPEQGERDDVADVGLVYYTDNVVGLIEMTVVWLASVARVTRAGLGLLVGAVYLLGCVPYTLLEALLGFLYALLTWWGRALWRLGVIAGAGLHAMYLQAMEEEGASPPRRTPARRSPAAQGRVRTATRRRTIVR